ncbi:MAG: hypothetical protein OJJ54_13020 [Pseudonocardia sp.]|nr:hypothetical protein [Pseudonocardia sp.]
MATLLTSTVVSGCSLLGAAPGERTFYVSPTDAAAGTSASTAWRTLERATSALVLPGERLLLQGAAGSPGDSCWTARTPATPPTRWSWVPAAMAGR